MLKLVLLAVVSLVFVQLVSAQTPQINIIPKPNSMQAGTGSFKLTKKTSIVAIADLDRTIAEFLKAELKRSHGLDLKITNKSAKGTISIGAFKGIAPLPAGGYELKVTPENISIAASDTPGRFYALQSLLQMIRSSGDLAIPAVTISDKPRFAYRGMHLDVSRHFFNIDFVKKYIDLMARYKFNTFHWHLTDDQGWRIEIKKYPKLTEIGSKRPESVKERNLNPYIGDGVPVEGFYTQEQIRDVVAYAKARSITVIPEIEMPGHSSAALAAYPEFGCKKDLKYKVQTTWGIFKEVYCPTEQTFKFLEDVISEVVDLFPDSPYIHVGGDEVLKDMWKDSPDVKELMARENLKDEHEVQSYFIRRMEKFINSKGKKIIGWDEILEGGVAPNATIMSWRGEKGGIEAAKAKHDVIMTPNTYVYFDYGQGDPAYEPLNIGSYIPLEKVYGWNPVPKDLTPDEAKYILGGQANIWTEYLQKPENVEYMAFPRMLALSEVLWTMPENKDFADFQRRLAAELPELDKRNVAYRIPEPVGLDNQVLETGKPAIYEISTPVPGAKIVYTTDGSTPTEASPVLPAKLSIPLGPKNVVTLKTVTILPNGRKSSVYASTVAWKMWHAPAAEPTDKRSGVTFAFSMPGGTGFPTILSGESKSAGFQQFARTFDLKQPFTASFDGYLNVASDGLYEFQADSTWDASVIVDSEVIAQQTGTKDRQTVSGVVPLRAGLHKVTLRYNNRGGDPVFRVRFGVKGRPLAQVSGAEMVH